MLLKPRRFYLDPGQQGQPFIADSHTCSPIPDPPPAGDGPPAGGGSGPPGGDLPICVMGWNQLVDADGNPLPGGYWLPINGPCRMPGGPA